MTSPNTPLTATFPTTILQTTIETGATGLSSTSEPATTSGLSRGAIEAIAGALGGVFVVAVITVGIVVYKLKTGQNSRWNTRVEGAQEPYSTTKQSEPEIRTEDETPYSG